MNTFSHKICSNVKHKCFIFQAYHPNLKYWGQKFASDTEVQSTVRQFLGQQPSSFFIGNSSAGISFTQEAILRFFAL